MENAKISLAWVSCPLPFKFRVRMIHHLRRYGLLYALIVGIAVIFEQNYAFGINASESLPHTLYLIHKGAAIHRGDYVAFRWHGGGPYPAGVTFIKIAAGVPGDRVTRIDRAYFVNGALSAPPRPTAGMEKPWPPCTTAYWVQTSTTCQHPTPTASIHATG